MASYEVEVCRIGCGVTRIGLDQPDARSAASAAVGMAGGVVFSEHSAEYEVNSVINCDTGKAEAFEDADPAPSDLNALKEALRKYAVLHDMLSDMTEGGRLRECDIPDDYAALCDQLAVCGGIDTKLYEV